jgi:hypothetical protein
MLAKRQLAWIRSASESKPQHNKYTKYQSMDCKAGILSAVPARVVNPLPEKEEAP